MKKLLLSVSLVAMSVAAMAETLNNYQAASEIVSGSKYLIAANADGTYKAAYALAESKTYGYLYANDETAVDGVISTAKTDADWTITAVEGGYTIQDIYGRYLYQTGTYNSFNVAAAMPEAGAVWTIAIADGKATITNTSVGKYIQYSTSYKSYGSYSTESGLLPELFVYTGSSDSQDPDPEPEPEPSAEVQEITLADFLQKADTETTYQLRGLVGEVKNTTYGNFYLVDGEASIYVYGLVLADGTTQQWTNLGIQQGDSIVLQGTYMLYNSTPEIKNAVYVSHKSNGSVEPDPDPEPDPEPGELTPDTAIDGNYFLNGSFESWTDDLPDYWKSTTTASSATLQQSEDPRTGDYSVLVQGASSNKRLAYRELVLAAGTYTFSFYAKAPAGNDACEVRPGYTPVDNDNKVGTYAYGEYAKVSTEWTLVQYKFELTDVTRLNMLIMNPKNCGDVIIDDARLEDGDKTSAIRVIRNDRKAAPAVSSSDAIDMSNAVVYNICGQRVSDMSKKGIYIVNGKKFVVR